MCTSEIQATCLSMYLLNVLLGGVERQISQVILTLHNSI